jgi:hypothetical protein
MINLAGGKEIFVLINVREDVVPKKNVREDFDSF